MYIFVIYISIISKNLCLQINRKSSLNSLQYTMLSIVILYIVSVNVSVIVRRNDNIDLEHTG
jgi:hypothetical protein